MSGVSLESVSKSYGGSFVVSDVDLDVAAGEFIVLLGPSGCGKTTTLRMIAGFVDPTRGRVRIGGDDVTLTPPRRRNIGMVFQNYALFPNMTVAGNVGFGLRQRRLPRAAIERRVEEMLVLVHLAEKRDDYVDQLSGGQQQRVALARALAASPRVLLMDEPLGALDLKMREALQVELMRIQRELKITTILVTHDQQEAMVLADRVVIMADGRIQQIGTPQELYRKPANAFVANFIGKNNLMTGRLVRAAAGLRVDLGAGVSVELGAATPPAAADGAIAISIRPEHLELLPAAAASTAIAGTIEQAVFLGNVVHYFVRTPWNQILLAERSESEPDLTPGSRVGVRWDAQRAVMFPAAWSAAA
jgi:ABC-type Fe3+/spermidine/putrescine transport system ATPase subunit